MVLFMSFMASLVWSLFPVMVIVRLLWLSFAAVIVIWCFSFMVVRFLPSFPIMCAAMSLLIVMVSIVCVGCVDFLYCSDPFFG